MKKTLIALMALAGVAVAADIEINTLTDSATQWNLGHANTSKRGEPSITGGVISTVLGNGGGTYDWAQEYAIYTLNKAITLTNVEDSLTLTFTYTPADTNAVALFTLVDSTNKIAISAGQGAYTGALQMGATTSIDGLFYNFKDESKDSRVLVNATASVESVVVADKALTLQNTIAWSTERNQFVSSVKYGDNVLGSVDVGESFSLSSINVSMDGNKNFNVTEVALKASVIPEPTTATLSLLALAGLAARRRRASR